MRSLDKAGWSTEACGVAALAGTVAAGLVLLVLAEVGVRRGEPNSVMGQPRFRLVAWVIAGSMVVTIAVLVALGVV